MDLSDKPDHIIAEVLYNLQAKVEWEGGWAEYAVYCGGEPDTGFPELDQAIAKLYEVNEDLHFTANALFTRYGVKF